MKKIQKTDNKNCQNFLPLKNRIYFEMKFADKVYKKCSQIPKGKVSTYGEIAKVLNSSPRAVGQVLRCNPYAPRVPCHRIVCSDGRIGGFMGKINGKEIDKKINLLVKEGIKIKNGRIMEFEETLHLFKK